MLKKILNFIRSGKINSDQEKTGAAVSGRTDFPAAEKKQIAEEILREKNRFLNDLRKASLNILEDVAESEQDLRKKTLELEKFQQAADVSFDHVIITDPDGIILYANAAAEKLTGYSRKEIIGKNSGQLWGGRMDKSFYEKMWKTIKMDKKPYSGEVTNKKKNGNEYLASIRISPILDREKEVKFFVGVEQDITEEREAQIRVIRHASELQKANELIEEEKERAEGILRFLKSIGDGVVATDMNAKIIFFNEAIEKLTKISSAEAMGKYSYEVFRFLREKELDKQHKIIPKFLSGKGKANQIKDRFILERKDGSRIFVNFSISFIYGRSGEKQGCIMVLRDITEERELEKTKDNFLSVAAHQLRTPLSGIRWNLEMLLEGDAGKLPKEALDIIKDLDENNQRLVALVNDLLNVSRINLGKSMDSPEPVEVKEAIKNAIKNLDGFAKRNNVKVVFDEKKTPNIKVMIIPNRFFESVENVASNAIKYSPNKSSVKIAVSQEAGKAVISVSDSGIGIPETDKEKIFSKFFRAHNAAIKDPEGSGLGLNVVKSFIEEAGGSVSFESKEGKGTTFLINLPVYTGKNNH